jgi:hypothetical protein
MLEFEARFLSLPFVRLAHFGFIVPLTVLLLMGRPARAVVL